MINIKKIFGLSGGLFGLLAVVLGAFGAHALKNKIDPNLLSVFQTGTQYQFYHAMVLLFLSISPTLKHSKLLKTSGLLFISGIIFFSFSLYAIALTGMRVFGIITPIGGVLLIFGWTSLSIAQLCNSNEKMT